MWRIDPVTHELCVYSLRPYIVWIRHMRSLYDDNKMARVIAPLDVVQLPLLF